ncbi:hypothetical protein [Lactococcus lactis]|uniref:hypothetical protein n=1 Tax=Lactococcus lactis TaxID=1358 RepID=UPI00191394D0|nr:hypothetical protein [Lactococcus lactis]WDA67255.1 hypothetical protein IL310_00375 [Lactococcus lactis]
MLKKVLSSSALALTLFGASGTAMTAVSADVVTNQGKTESNYRLALSEKDSYSISGQFFTYLSGAAIIGEQNTAKVFLLNNEGKEIAQLNVRNAAADLISFHAQPIETSELATSIRVNIYNSTGEQIKVLTDSLNVSHL